MIIVGNGKVSRAIRRPSDVILMRSDLDLKTASIDEAVSVLSAAKKAGGGTAVVNCAAKIDLEWCEDNAGECYAVNAVGAGKLAVAARKVGGLKFVHISSGCVFDGGTTGRVFTEDDEPNPASCYAAAKVDGDRMVREADPEALILRPRQLISPKPDKSNMLTKFLGLLPTAKFIDVDQSITCIEDMAAMLQHLLRTGVSGIYNCVNTGTISPLKIARALKEVKNDISTARVEYDEYVVGLRVRRVNATLSVDKLLRTGYTPRTAHDALEWCVANYGKEAVCAA